MQADHNLNGLYKMEQNCKQQQISKSIYYQMLSNSELNWFWKMVPKIYLNESRHINIKSLDKLKSAVEMFG